MLFLLIFYFSSNISDILSQSKDTANALRILSVLSILAATNGVHIWLANRSLDFKIQTKIAFASALASSIISIGLAYFKFGIWALVSQFIVSQIITTIGFWYFIEWRPSLFYSIKELRRILSYSLYILGGNLIESLSANFSSLLIGSIYPSQLLGYYNRGESISLLPYSLFTRGVGRFCFSHFSKQNSESQLEVDNILFAQKISNYFIFPFVCIVYLVCRPLVEFLFGEKWTYSADILKFLIFTNLAIGYSVINSNAMLAYGFSKIIFNIQILKKCIYIILMGSFGVYNYSYLPIAAVISSIICVFLDILILSRTKSISLSAQLSHSLKIVMNTLIIWFVLSLVIHQYAMSNIVQIFFIPTCGAILYVLLSYLSEEELLRSLISSYAIKSSG